MKKTYTTQELQEKIEKTKKFLGVAIVATYLGVGGFFGGGIYLQNSKPKIVEAVLEKEFYLESLNKKQNQLNQKENFSYLEEKASKEIFTYNFAKREMSRVHEIHKKETEKEIEKMKNTSEWKEDRLKSDKYLSILEALFAVGLFSYIGGLIREHTLVNKLNSLENKLIK